MAYKCVGGGYGVPGLRQINTYRKVPLQVNIFTWRHFALPSDRIIFLRIENCLNERLSLNLKWKSLRDEKLTCKTLNYSRWCTLDTDDPYVLENILCALIWIWSKDLYADIDMLK